MLVRRHPSRRYLQHRAHRLSHRVTGDPDPDLDPNTHPGTVCGNTNLPANKRPINLTCLGPNELADNCIADNVAHCIRPDSIPHRIVPNVVANNHRPNGFTGRCAIGQPHDDAHG